MKWCGVFLKCGFCWLNEIKIKPIQIQFSLNGRVFSFFLSFHSAARLKINDSHSATSQFVGEIVF